MRGGGGGGNIKMVQLKNEQYCTKRLAEWVATGTSTSGE